MEKRLKKLLKQAYNEGAAYALKGSETYSFDNFLKDNEKQLRLCGVVKSLPSKHDMWEERGKQVVKLEESNTSFSKHTPHLLGFTLGFEKCYEWLTK